MQSFEILLYSAPEGKTHIEVFFEDDTFWLSQKKMAELFGADVRTINEYLQNIFKARELESGSTIRKFRIVQQEGGREVSRDYDKDAFITKQFFATVQNKLHWAITGKTAAEIIYTEADASKLFMGLKTWKHAPDGKVIKSDVSVAKNYLNESQDRKYVSDFDREVEKLRGKSLD